MEEALINSSHAEVYTTSIKPFNQLQINGIVAHWEPCLQQSFLTLANFIWQLWRPKIKSLQYISIDLSYVHMLSRSIFSSVDNAYFERRPCFDEHMKCDWLDMWLQACCVLFLHLFFNPTHCFLCEDMWSLLDQRWASTVGSIISESSSPGRGITACQLRVKYFSQHHPLVFHKW